MRKNIQKAITICLMICMSLLASMPVQARILCKDPHCGNTAAYADGKCGRHSSYYDSSLCAHPGCKKKKYCGSYCATHDICTVKSACKTANYGGRKICKNEHCGNTATYSDGYCGRHTSSKSTGSSYSSSSSSKTCFKSGCSKSRATGSVYCYSHMCLKSGCISSAVTGSGYCSKHKTSGTYSSGKKSDPYDVYDYDDADDFADEWEDEFEDWDDAWDYYEEHHE